MAGAADDKDEQESVAGDSAGSGAGAVSGRGATGKSLAARRRRIEMMRERQELMALLDDFGDGELDAELVLELADDEDDTQWVAFDQADPDDEEDLDLDEDDDDYVDDDEEFPDED